MKIEVFEASCCRPTNIFGVVEQAINVNGVKAEITRTSDMMEALKRGIMRAPAIIINDKVVCTGRIPSYEEVSAWILKNAL